MCNPIAMMVISAAQSAAEISAKNQSLTAEQNSAIEQQKIMNQQRTMEMEEQNRKTSLELTQEKRETLQKQSAIRVAAAESGVSGGSTLRNLANVYVQDSFNAGSIVSLNEAQIAQIGVQSQADFISTRNRINIAQSSKSTGIAAALQIGGAAASGYSAGGGFEKGTTFKGHWNRAFS